MSFVTWPAVSIIPWIKTTIIQSCLFLLAVQKRTLKHLKWANLYRLIGQNNECSKRNLWFRWRFGFGMSNIEFLQCWQLVEQHVHIKCSSNERTKLLLVMNSNLIHYYSAEINSLTLIMLRKWYCTNLTQRNKEGIKALLWTIC